MKKVTLLFLAFILVYLFTGCKEEPHNEYYYEPSISVVEGRLITKMYYGAPNYGENPETDHKEYP